MVNIEVVYGTDRTQKLLHLAVNEGTNAREAVLQSGMNVYFADVDLASAPLGVFGKRVKDDYIVRERDRIEIYRSLLIDPKEARRLRVQSKNVEE